MLYQHIFNQLEILSPEIYEIFQIGRLLEEEPGPGYQVLIDLLDASEFEKNETDPVNGPRTVHETKEDWHVDVMRRIQDFPYILKKQFLLPDEAFDQKLISKELLVKQSETKEEHLDWESYFADQNRLTRIKRQKRQSTYLLVDVSGTTANHFRILLEKAICLRFIDQNQRQKGTLFLRFFNHEPGPLVASINGEKPYQFWSSLFSPVAPFGGTNLQKALLQALADIEFRAFATKTEVLVLTDGLTKIDKDEILQKSPNIKINVVIIGNDMPDLNDAEMKQLFDEKIRAWKVKWEEKLEKNDYQKHLAELEKKFWADRGTEQQSYYHQLNQSFQDLAAETGGLFMVIPDLGDDFFSSERISNALLEELDKIKNQVNLDLPVTEKEKLLERIISLQNYINALSQRLASKAKNQKEVLKEISGELRSLVENNETLMDILKYERIKVRLSASGSADFLTLAELFRLLFVKMKHYFARYRA